MRNLVTIILFVFCANPLFASEKLKVVTTFTILADMVENVAGERVEVVSITKPGADIHNYTATPQDILRAQDADLVVWNGLGLELWFARFFKRLKDVPVVVASAGVTPLPIQSGAYSGKPNPHAWMSLSDAKIYIDNIAAALSAVDSAHESEYAARATAYKKELENAVAPMIANLKTLPEEQKWLVTSEGAFSYLVRDLGFNEAYLWPINAEQQGTVNQMLNVIEIIKEHDVPAIFSESTISANTALQIADETGVYYGGVLYVDSLSGPEGPVPTYLDLLMITLKTIEDGLFLG